MIRGKKLSSRRYTNLLFFLVAHCLIFLITSLSGWGGGDAHGRGGDAQGGEGGCTCILCIPPGYATGTPPPIFPLYHTVLKTRGKVKIKTNDYSPLKKG